MQPLRRKRPEPVAGSRVTSAHQDSQRQLAGIVNIEITLGGIVTAAPFEFCGMAGYPNLDVAQMIQNLETTFMLIDPDRYAYLGENAEGCWD